MTCGVNIPDAFRADSNRERTTNIVSPQLEHGLSTVLRGLLITTDHTLARVFRREVSRCVECSLSLVTRETHEDAVGSTSGVFDWIAVDLDGAIAPSEAVRLAREAWNDTSVAVLSMWWSERDTVARELADVVIHKPLRTPELLAFLRAASSGTEPLRARDREEHLSTSTG